jgi:DNA-binding CsgD family transcriptional regulator
VTVEDGSRCRFRPHGPWWRRSLASSMSGVRWLNGVAPGMPGADVGLPIIDPAGRRSDAGGDQTAATGRLDEARKAARRALATGHGPVTTAVARLRLAAVSFGDGRVGEAAELADAVLGVEALPAEVRGAARTIRLLAALAHDDPPRIRRAVEVLLTEEHATASGDPAAAALLALGLLAWDDGRVTDALGLLGAAAERVERTEGVTPVGLAGSSDRPAWSHGRQARRDQQLQPRLTLGAVLASLGDLDGARAEIAAVDRRTTAGSAGELRWHAAVQVARAQVHLVAGDLAEAVDEARAGLAAAEGQGAWLLVSVALTVLAEAELATGDLRGAEEDLGRHDDGWRERSGGVPLPVAARWVGVRLSEIRLGAVASAPTIVPLADDLPHRKRLLLEEPAAAAWFVRVLLTVDERPRAEVIAGCAELIAAGNPGHPTLAASSAHAQGLLAGDADLLIGAADQHRHPWPRGSAAEDAAMVLSDAGDRGGARSGYQRALVAYERAGAVRDAARVRRRLAAPAYRRRGDRPVGGWASLTDTERRVAHVVAAGLTNAEAAHQLYLSRHTIDYHLRQIFRKLAIRSRVELATVVAGRAQGGVLSGPLG